MVPTYFLSIFGKDVFQARHIPKSGLGGIPNLGHFLPPPNHTSISLQLWTLPLLHWLGCKMIELLALLRLSLRLVWHYFIFFIFMRFLSLWFCLIFLCVSCRLDFVLFLLHVFLATMALSYFFVHFLLLWLCLISAAMAWHYFTMLVL